MDFSFLPENAAELLKFLSPLLPLVVTYVITKTNWDKILKIAVTFSLCAVIAILTSYSEGNIKDNFWTNFTQIFTATQIVYWGLLKALKLEQYLVPKEAVADKAEAQVRQEIAGLSKEQAKDILSNETPTKIVTDAKIVSQ